MGKRRKRLTMEKYAKKYASVREAVFEGAPAQEKRQLIDPEPPLKVELADHPPEPAPATPLDPELELVDPPAEALPEVSAKITKKKKISRKKSVSNQDTAKRTHLKTKTEG